MIAYLSFSIILVVTDLHYTPHRCSAVWLIAKTRHKLRVLNAENYRADQT